MRKLLLKLSVIWAVIRSGSFYFVNFPGDETLEETRYGINNNDLLDIKEQIEEIINENI